MKLALSYHNMAPIGGLERYLLTFARRLQERGHQLHLVGIKVSPEFENASNKVTRVELGGLPSALQLKEFSREAENLRQKLDADFWLGFGRTISQDVHRAGGGCHARYSELLPWMKRIGFKNKTELALENSLYTSGKTRHFVVNSHQVGQQLSQEYGVEEEKISVIHTAVDAAHFRPMEEKRINPNPVLLFVSSHHQRKGLDTLLKAARKIKKAQIWVAGRKPGLSWRMAVANQGMSSRVKWIGQQEDMAPIYQAADFFVHPTRYDACANTVLQAMASGLPSIVSSADGAQEFIENGTNGLILRDPNSASELQDHIATLLSLPRRKRLEVGQAARERVLPLSWGNHIEKWIDLLQHLGSNRKQVADEEDAELETAFG